MIPLKKGLNLENNKVILYSGSLSEYHNPKFLGQVIGLVYKKDPNIKFLFIGGGNLMKKFVSRFENVIYRGEVPREQVPNYINMADVCISTMDPEYPTVAVKVYDYLACNKKVISNIDYSYLFGSDVTTADTPEKFADKIMSLKGNGYGRAIILEKYDRKLLAQKYSQLLKELSNEVIG